MKSTYDEENKLTLSEAQEKGEEGEEGEEGKEIEEGKKEKKKREESLGNSLAKTQKRQQY